MNDKRKKNTNEKYEFNNNKIRKMFLIPQEKISPSQKINKI